MKLYYDNCVKQYTRCNLYRYTIMTFQLKKIALTQFTDAVILSFIKSFCKTELNFL